MLTYLSPCIVVRFDRYADRAKAIKVKANTINNVTSTSTGVQNGNSSKPGGGGSRTPMHQLRQKLGDTEASREKLEEEVRALPSRMLEKAFVLPLLLY